MRGRSRTNVFVLAALCALFSLLCALQAFASPHASALADAAYFQPSRAVDRRAEARDFPTRANYTPPRHELAGHYSFDRRTRGRSSELYGLDETDWSVVSKMDSRLRKDAEKASREAIRHAYRSYVAQFVREATEGGKNVFNEPDLLIDWRDALRPILPH